MSRCLVIAPGYGDLIRELGLLDPRRAPAFERGRLVTNPGSSRVFEFRHPDEEGAPRYFFKVYRYYRPRRMVTFTYRPCVARVEYEALVRLREAGVPAAEPVAWGSHRILRVVRSCFILTRAVEGTRDLDVFLPDYFARPRTQEWVGYKRRGLETLAGMVRRMHAAGFFDGNLVFRNILVREDADPSFWFIDHPKGRVIPAWRGAARRQALIHDLASLGRQAPEWFSRTECLRFFLQALGAPGLGEEEKRLFRSVVALRRHMLRKRDSKLKKVARRGKRPVRPWPAGDPSARR